MKRSLVAAFVLAAAVASIVAASALAGKPALAFNPATSFTFPPMQPGGSGGLEATLTFTGKPNSGTLTVRLSTDSSSAFVITTNNCDGETLVNNETCTLEVEYNAPTSYSQTDTGTLIATGKGNLKATIALTGSTVAPPTCTTGSENFSGFNEGAQPTTFSGGTINSTYGTSGGIYVVGNAWEGEFPDGTHLLFTGYSRNSFKLTFNNAVASVQLDVISNTNQVTNETLSAYTASNTLVGSNGMEGVFEVHHLTVNSTTNNIKYFTITTSDLSNGLAFTNISWGCSS